MTYDPRWVVAAAERHLQRTPSLRLNAMASACGVSRATLTRALKTEALVSYRQLKQRCLRDIADALLEETPQRSIKEVAFALGFATPGSFARWLKLTTGHTPLIRRRRLSARTNDEAGVR